MTSTALLIMDVQQGIVERFAGDDGYLERLAAAIAAAEAELGDSGRVLVRPSGTEPAVRVMVEAAEATQAERLAGTLADAIRAVG